MGKMIGPRIKLARKKINMAQAELARRVGVSQPTVSDWESGQSDPIVENMSSIAILLNVNFEWLATGRGEMEYINGISEPHADYHVMPEDQRELLDSYLKLKPGQRAALLDFLKKL